MFSDTFLARQYIQIKQSKPCIDGCCMSNVFYLSLREGKAETMIISALNFLL